MKDKIKAVFFTALTCMMVYIALNNINVYWPDTTVATEVKLSNDDRVDVVNQLIDLERQHAIDEIKLLNFDNEKEIVRLVDDSYQRVQGR